MQCCSKRARETTAATGSAASVTASESGHWDVLL